jgi:protein-S-isoprenylcysteine O-methyltransferase Ste14
MYSSLLFGVWGVFLKHCSVLSTLLTLMTTLLALLTAKMEESRNIGYFGDTYRDYVRGTKMFVPFIF